ncbi:Amphicalbin [Oopsacas minuta]|uniref:Amphicalbin n=1 Tax=Oopsacas minuta TaxID=111878 RepID=A0AAV7KGY6_9METZ|nr:Amphicalbin [Oopsacas minuta]
MVEHMNITEKKALAKQAEQLCTITHFSKSETEKLLHLFYSITQNRIDRPTFKEILHNDFDMTTLFFMERVFKAFDLDNDGFIDEIEWVKGLSIFLRGTIDEKIKYCFYVYDLNNDFYISREEMFHMLKTSMIKQPTEEDPEEGIKDLIELILKKMDLDHDGKLSPGDFEKSVQAEPLLLEAFGPCLPSWCSVYWFSGKL